MCVGSNKLLLPHIRNWDINLLLELTAIFCTEGRKSLKPSTCSVVVKGSSSTLRCGPPVLRSFHLFYYTRNNSTNKEATVVLILHANKSRNILGVPPNLAPARAPGHLSLIKITPFTSPNYNRISLQIAPPNF